MADFVDQRVKGRRLGWIIRILRPMGGWIGGLRRHDQPPQRVSLVKHSAGAENYLPTMPAAEFKRRAKQDQVTATLLSLYQWVLSTIADPQARPQFIINRLPALLGRVPEVTVWLEQDGNISRHHAELYGQVEALRLRVLHSKYGTRVNGRAIEDEPLAPSDRIQVGYSRLIGEQRKAPL
jgi:hypothetical protein